MALTDPSKEDAHQLFQEVEQHFPSSSLGEERWQIVAVCIDLRFLANGRPELMSVLDLGRVWRRPSRIRSRAL